MSNTTSFIGYRNSTVYSVMHLGLVKQKVSSNMRKKAPIQIILFMRSFTRAFALHPYILLRGGAG